MFGRRRLLLVLVFLLLYLLGGLVIWLTYEAPGFTDMDPDQTGVTFRNDLREDESSNIVDYLYFYNGAGVAAGDLNGDGWIDLVFTSNQGENKLYFNEGNWVFKDGTEASGFHKTGDWSTGVTLADVNNDGAVDIYVSQVQGILGWEGHNALFINDGQGHFTEEAAQRGLAIQGLCQQAAFLDADQDGDLDVYILKHSVHPSGSFAQANARTDSSALAGDQFLRNDGTGHFTDATHASGIYQSEMGYGLGVVAQDINLDGLPDLYITNDFYENDYLYLNQGGGRFTNVLPERAAHTSKFSMGVDAADLDGNGLPDFFTLDMRPEDEETFKRSLGADAYQISRYKESYGFQDQYPRNHLHLATGKDQAYREVAQAMGVDATDWSWSVLLADFDQDAVKDLFITNGIKRRPNDLDYLNYITGVPEEAPDSDIYAKMPPGATANRAFRQTPENRGTLGALEDRGEAWGLDLVGYSNGAAYADLDNDGDLDLIVNNLDDVARLYRNDIESEFEKENGHPPAWVGVDVRTTTGAPALGARVDYTTVPHANGSEQVWATRGWCSASDTRVRIPYTRSCTVYWPDGTRQNVELIENTYTEVRPAATRETYSKALPTATTLHEVKEVEAHREDAYSDFLDLPLALFAGSEWGPAAASVEVKDGNLVFLGGSFGQKSKLYHFDSSRRTFQLLETVADSSAETISADWTDLDHDGDPDVVVATGGNHFARASEAMQDYWLENRQGHFVKHLLPSHSNASDLLVFDQNGDGALDILIVEAMPIVGAGEALTRPMEHQLLLQMAPGVFAKSEWAQLQQLGPVWDVERSTTLFPYEGRTTLAFAREYASVALLVAGEKPGEWGDLQPIGRAGHWRSVRVLDGALFAGNVGSNHGLDISTEHPLTYYLKDFDKNGEEEALVAVWKQDAYYPYATRDELIRQMAGLKKKFLYTTDVAGKTFDQLFGASLDGAVERRVEETHSGWLRPDKNGDWYFQAEGQRLQEFPIRGVEAAQDRLWFFGGQVATHPEIGKLNASTLVSTDAWGEDAVQCFQGRVVKAVLALQGALLLVTNDGPIYLYQP